jgi:hypothetical protein
MAIDQEKRKRILDSVTSAGLDKAIGYLPLMSAAILRGSASKSVIDRQMDWQHSGAQEFGACATMHGSLEGL